MKGLSRNPGPVKTGGSSAEFAWVNQSGRIPSRTSSFADGFRGKAPYAAVAVVAECSIEDSGCARSAVAQVRDAFAEGVAYGVDEVLADAFDRLRESWIGTGHEQCSIAAVAVLGREAWIASAGSCHAFMADPGSEGSIDLESDTPRNGVTSVRKVVLREGQSIVLVTHNLRKLMGSSAAAKYTTGCSDPLGNCLKTMVAETRIRFRKTGGSVAAMRFSREPSSLLPRKLLLLGGAAVLFLILAVLILPGLFRGSGTVPDPAGSASLPVEPVIVMPLETDTAETVPIEEPVPDPVSALLIAESASGLDSLPSLSLTLAGAEPDPRWENAARGIYYIADHARADSMARQINALTTGEDFPLVAVTSVVTVRQGGISAFADWLRALDPEEAGTTAVIVETSSSVAGGADWIEDFALFANGDRTRQDLPSSYTGTPAMGVPASVDSSGYSMIIVP